MVAHAHPCVEEIRLGLKIRPASAKPLKKQQNFLADFRWFIDNSPESEFVAVRPRETRCTSE